MSDTNPAPSVRDGEAVDHPEVDAELEIAARSLAAFKIASEDPTGSKLPDDVWQQAIPEALAVLSADLIASAPVPDQSGVGETLETIAQWCEETFGPIQPERIVSRAGEEMDELRAEPTRVEEAADVVICLARYPGLWAAVERKMAVNRARKWRLMGDGTGYHIKATEAQS